VVLAGVADGSTAVPTEYEGVSPLGGTEDAAEGCEAVKSRRCAPPDELDRSAGIAGAGHGFSAVACTARVLDAPLVEASALRRRPDRYKKKTAAAALVARSARHAATPM
jgi:hypothetical protein